MTSLSNTINKERKITEHQLCNTVKTASSKNRQNERMTQQIQYPYYSSSSNLIQLNPNTVKPEIIKISIVV